MKKIIIMQGVPGSGKTTYILKHYPSAFICSADDFFIINGKYRYDKEYIGVAHKTCFFKFKAAIEDRLPEIVIDNTNISNKEMERYAELGALNGYEIQVIAFRFTSPETAASRNVHGVPGEKVLDMYKRLETPKYATKYIYQG